MKADDLLQLFKPLDSACHCAGIYLLFKGPDLVYCGQSGDVGFRVATHQKQGRDFDRVLYAPFARMDRSDLLRWEAIFILLLQPKENALIALRLTQSGVSELPYTYMAKAKKKKG